MLVVAADTGRLTGAAMDRHCASMAETSYRAVAQLARRQRRRLDVVGMQQVRELRDALGHARARAGSRPRRRRRRRRARPCAGTAPASLTVRSRSKPQGASTTSCGAASAHGVPGRRERALARPAEHLVAAGEVHHLRHPVPGGERRVEPLGDEHALARQAAHQLVHEVDAVVHRLREPLAPRGCTPRCRASVRIDSSISLQVARIQRDRLDVDCGRRA